MKGGSPHVIVTESHPLIDLKRERERESYITGPSHITESSPKARDQYILMGQYNQQWNSYPANQDAVHGFVKLPSPSLIKMLPKNGFNCLIPTRIIFHFPSNFDSKSVKMPYCNADLLHARERKNRILLRLYSLNQSPIPLFSHQKGGLISNWIIWAITPSAACLFHVSCRRLPISSTICINEWWMPLSLMQIVLQLCTTRMTIFLFFPFFGRLQSSA